MLKCDPITIFGIFEAGSNINQEVRRHVPYGIGPPVVLIWTDAIDIL
jgi:hypothetical protein